MSAIKLLSCNRNIAVLVKLRIFPHGMVFLTTVMKSLSLSLSPLLFFPTPPSILHRNSLFSLRIMITSSFPCPRCNARNPLPPLVLLFSAFPSPVALLPLPGAPCAPPYIYTGDTFPPLYITRPMRAMIMRLLDQWEADAASDDVDAIGVLGDDVMTSVIDVYFFSFFFCSFLFFLVGEKSLEISS